MLQGADNEQQRKAAIHDALCEKYNVESLAEFVEWQRNHIAELEAAPPAHVGHGEAAVMPDYPGYTLTQRECFQAGKEAGLAEAGNSPVIPDGLRLALSNAGIAAPESDEILAATCDKYIQALVDWVKDRKPFQSSPVIPYDWVLVPVELTTDMRAAWDSAPYTDDDDNDMQAAYRAMIAAAPQQEVK
ncbi:hypothetical protein [Enterobacter cloacae complex sp. P31C]|uniref:hypothetical protein n=1 Tax=Enterobacter cloacae complex sp. P31C TaxID=2779560 RepID=UPI001867019E|nr:hypothetical protein [Enterobacter cloacae complex sp. P31C]MBE3289564.1 hypothetical protein [Enterobacter cloacae complex sp. P31C]